jgi:hypothetical protein
LVKSVVTDSRPPKPELFVRRIEDGTISGPALRELLQAVLDRGVPFRFRATGFSMTPFVRDGDVITVAPLAGRSIGPGDVVGFVRPDTGKLVVHRVVGQKGDAFLIRGDYTGETDGPIEVANILGCVTRVEREGKTVDLGLGPERRLIAVLTRWGFFYHMLPRLWPILRPTVHFFRRVHQRFAR